MEIRRAPTALAAALGASPLGGLATLALYRGLQVGRVGLVSPVAGAYGAVTAALSLAAGETIGRPAVVGVAAVVAGTCWCPYPPGTNPGRGTEAA